MAFSEDNEAMRYRRVNAGEASISLTYSTNPWLGLKELSYFLGLAMTLWQ